MRSRSIKKLLLSLIVVGVIGSFTAGGTFAVLNGAGSNPNSQLASGTLLMQNSVFGGAQQPCASQTVSLNVNTGCDALFTSGNLYPIPSSPNPPAIATYVYADMTIKNAGTLPGTVSIYMPSCVATTTTGAPGFSWSAINPCCPGGAYPCTDGLKGSLDFFIQEYSTGLAPPSGSGTAMSTCIWPISASAACTFVDDSLGDFNSQHHDNTHYLSLGTIAAGASRYFRIAIAEPTDAVNGLQGQTATFAIYWHMQ